MESIDIAFTEAYLITFSGFLIIDGILNGSTEFSVVQFWSVHSLFYLISVTLLGHVVLRVMGERYQSRLNDMPRVYCFMSFVTLATFSCMLIDAQDVWFGTTDDEKLRKSRILLMLYGGAEIGNYTSWGIASSAVVFTFLFVAFFMSLYLTLTFRGEENPDLLIFSFDNLLAISIFISSVTENVTHLQLPYCKFDWAANIGFIFIITIIYGIQPLVHYLQGMNSLDTNVRGSIIEIIIKVLKIITVILYVTLQFLLSSPTPTFTLFFSIVILIICTLLLLYEFITPEVIPSTRYQKIDDATEEVVKGPIEGRGNRSAVNDEIWVLRERKRTSK